MPATIPTEDLIAELQRLADELCHTPSQNEMAAHGAHAHATYQDRFGSWNEAINAAGLEPNPGGRRGLSDEDLLDELRRLADELDRTPTCRNMKRQGRYDPSTYRYRFGSWNAAIEEIGLGPNLRGGEGAPSNDELLEVLQALAIELERTPEYEDVTTYTDINPEWYLTRWDSWWIACSMAGVTQADLAGVFDAHDEADMEGSA